MARKIWTSVLTTGAGLGFLWARHQQNSNMNVLVNTLENNYINDRFHTDQPSSEDCIAERLPDNSTIFNCSTRCISTTLEYHSNPQAELFRMIADKEFSAFYFLKCILAGSGLAMLMFCCCGFDERHDDKAIIAIITGRDDKDEEQAAAIVVEVPSENPVQRQRLLINTAPTLRERLSKTDCSDEEIPHEMIDHIYSFQLMNRPLLLIPSGFSIDEEAYNNLPMPKMCPFKKIPITTTILNETFLNAIEDFVSKQESRKKQNDLKTSELPRPR